VCLCASLTTSRESLSPEVIEKINIFRSMILGRLVSIFTLAQQDKTIAAVSDPAAEAAALLPLLEGAQLAARAEIDVSRFDSALTLITARLS